MDALIRILLIVGRIPGCSGLADFANDLIAKRSSVAGIRAQARERMDEVDQVRGSAGSLMSDRGGSGAGGIDPNETVVRAPPGAAPDSERTILRPRPGGSGGGFGDGDRTIMRPRPGGVGNVAPAPIPRQSVPVRGSGLNPIVDSATGLLTLIGQLRNTIAHPNVEALRGHVAQQIQTFDAAARNAGAAPEAVLAARYSLCTLTDETVLRTPWGMESSWSAQSTLSQFHNETFGGEKFFLMLERAIQEPARNLHLLEFMYMCLAFGLEGRYGVQEGGRTRLAQVQDNLFRTIRYQRGDFERDLSPHWMGITDHRSRLTRYVPLWVVAAFAAALLTACYVGFTYYLTESSDPVYAKLARVGRTQVKLTALEPVEPAEKVAPPVVVEPPKPAERTVTLREVLADDIEKDLLAVDDTSEGTRVSVKGDGLFALGSASLKKDVIPLVTRIARAMDQIPGRILITGHTDATKLSVRMKLKFPSNWHLSQARADSVAELVSKDIADPSRIVAEGRGATEPIATNATRQGRAKNRRVELTLIRTGTANSQDTASPVENAPSDGKAPETKGGSA